MWQLDWSKLAEVLTYNAKQPMIFSSGLFLFLFLGFSLIYMLLQKKDTARILFVTLFSYYFYYKSSGFYFFLLGVVTVTDFLLAGRMANTETQWKRRVLLLASLGINLGLLCYFKYTNFFYQATFASNVSVLLSVACMRTVWFFPLAICHNWLWLVASAIFSFKLPDISGEKA